MADNSTVFGLRHQARCLTAVKSNSDKSQFMAGSIGAKDNIVCLLAYDDDNNTIASTLYNHPDEVWDIASCPYDEQLFFTCHSSVASQNPLSRKATLWQRKETTDTSNYNNNDQRQELNHLLQLEYEGVKKVLWCPQEQNHQIIAMGRTHLYLSSIESDTSESILSIDASSLFTDETELPSLELLQNAVWNPHQPELIAVADNTFAGWDLRSGSNTFTRRKAHESTMRAIDYNPNKPYHMATGGDDAFVKIWDTRQLKDPVMTLEGHTHWVWSVAFNSLQDQLLLTSSSDTVVNLHNVVSVSSAAYFEDYLSADDDETDEEGDSRALTKERMKPTDGLVCTYDQHEDSVYSVAWSAIDTWTFASISYAGRIVINQVPTQEKIKILGV
ncbi:WD40-repeat-containing domain protein [Mycotypha africana]|uniref:WD40-repeat-containing domain protein n=1 Tax=Mycotypha africana TaxID=64632 RepID=UPI0023016092|nr:WD40-repeat-containing domain protein [Mycotypha africana]KAI8969991.1 WD40-repeat-containing domain protein [Mycotypha africana]